MKKTLYIFFMATLAGYANLSAGAATETEVVKVNSYIYKVSATRSKNTPNALEEATKYVKAKAKTFCARNKRIVEIDSLARFDADMRKPASANLRFRCNKPD